MKRIVSLMLLCVGSLVGTHTYTADKTDVLGQTISPHNIILFIEPLLMHKPSEKLKDIAIKIPQNIAHAELKAYLIKNIFLFASYTGLVSYSDHWGEITFPRRHEQDEITCIVTPEIKPILLKNTVQNIIIQKKTPAKTYKFIRKFSEEDNLWYWTVSEEKTAKDTALPLATLFIFAKPEHIYIPLEKTVTVGGPNLVLPTIYATKLMNTDVNALLFLKESRYFRPLKKMIKVSDDRIGMQVF